MVNVAFDRQSSSEATQNEMLTQCNQTDSDASRGGNIQLIIDDSVSKKVGYKQTGVTFKKNNQKMKSHVPRFGGKK